MKRVEMKIGKLKKRLVCAIGVSVIAASAFPAWAYAAPRDIQLHWSGPAVNTLLEYGILQEESPGRFKPDRNMTRREAASFLAAYIREREPELIEQKTEIVSFSDVEVGWEKENAEFLASLGIVSGYPDGTFRPDLELSREAFTSMVYRLEEAVEKLSEESQTVSGAAVAAPLLTFSDISESYARDAILAMTAKNVLHGYSDGTFRPGNAVTRGEAASILFSLSGYEAIVPQVELPDSRVIDVPYISQIYPYGAWVGCEATSLLMGMKAKGYALDLTLKDFLDAMPKTSQDPAKGFAGSPYVPDKKKLVRTTIYPKPLADFASAYGRVLDFSGSSVEELQAELLDGNPVVVYVTMWWEKPFYRSYEIEGSYQYLLSNNHVVLACGYDRSTGNYYIADPYNVNMPDQEYKYWIEGGIFERLYNVRRHALVVE